jgi:hypothetical protein
MPAMLTPGSVAPPWPAKQLTLSGPLGKPVILTFNPADCRVCLRTHPKGAEERV